MIDIVALVAPILLMIGIGAAFLRFGWFPAEGLPVLNEFLMKVCIPPLLFSAVTSGNSVGDFAYLNTVVFAAASLLSAGCVVLILRAVLGQGWPQAIILGMGGACANSIFLGFPIASAIIPDRAAQVFAWVILAEILFIIPIVTTLALLAEDRGGKATVGRTLLPLLRSPVTIGLAAGFAFLASGLALPGMIDDLVQTIVRAAPFIALFVIGGMLTQSTLSRMGPQVGVMTVAKLVLHPVLVGAAFALVFGTGSTVTRDAILFAAMPVFATSVVFCGRHGVADICASAVVLSTLLGAVTVMVLLSWYA